MKLENIFKNLILVHIFIMILSFFFGMYPPENLENINQMLEQNNWFHSDESSATAFLILLLIAFLVYFYSLYGLYKFKKISRNLYLYTLIFFTIAIIFMGDYAYSGFEFFLYDIGVMINGALVVFIYFTDLKKKFK